MKTFNNRFVQYTKDFQLLLNFIIVIFNASIFLICTQYICENGLERSFLEELTHLSSIPEKIYIQSIVLCLVLIFFIKNKYMTQLKAKNDLVIYVEILIVIFIIFKINGSYNGIILVVLADVIYNSKSIKHWVLQIVIFVGVLLMTNYELLSTVVAMPSIGSYINYLPMSQKALIFFIKNILETFNVICFIGFLITNLMVQEKEKQSIKEKLEYVSEVNEQLKTYAALTEKIGEDNERKRISREIHDTLGHALTGILAGVDACRVLIDLDVDKTKQQLAIVSDVVRQGIKDVRGSLNKLRPGVLDESTLKDALMKMIKEFHDVSQLQIELYYEWENIDLEKTKEDIIYRIIQESITNALRHGKASKVEINMFSDEYKYMIVIQDNGEGCKDIVYGYGLKQMQERVSILDGNISFYGENGFRTVVEFRK